MQVIIKSRNMEITDAIRDYTEKRLAKLDRLIGSQDATVTMRCIKDSHKIEVNIPYNGVLIRGEEEGHDMYACIDLVTDKLERQINKYRSRLIQRNHRQRDAVPQVEEPLAAGQDVVDKPVRVKHYTTRPMSVDEAIMQMNLLSHGFFAFYDCDTDSVSVVYRRNDGAYGLLTPDN